MRNTHSSLHGATSLSQDSPPPEPCVSGDACPLLEEDQLGLSELSLSLISVPDWFRKIKDDKDNADVSFFCFS